MDRQILNSQTLFLVKCPFCVTLACCLMLESCFSNNSFSKFTYLLTRVIQHHKSEVNLTMWRIIDFAKEFRSVMFGFIIDNLLLPSLFKTSTMTKLLFCGFQNIASISWFQIHATTSL